MTGLNVLLRELEPLWHPLSVLPPQAQLRFSLLHLLSQVAVFVLTMNLPI